MSLQQRETTNMVLTIRYTKAWLSKFKSKGDSNIYISEFNNVCQADREIVDEDKLTIFLIILRKLALKWYT